MYDVRLTDNELDELIKYEKKHKDWSIKRRIRCIRLRDEGISCKEICKRLEISYHSVTQWTKKYLESGIKELCRLNSNQKRRSHLDNLIKETKNYAKKKKIKKVAHIQDFLEQKTGKRYEFSWIWRWCKKHGIIANT